jgi:protein-S-isoprenylcysteine O-methyltransferase Ste14
MPTLVTVLRWFTLATWLFWLAVYWKGGQRVLTDIRHAIEEGNSRLDPLLLITIALLGQILVLTGLSTTLGWVVVPAWAQRWPVALAGALLTLLGMLGTFYCRSYLGRFWTAETALQPDHRVIDSGPYSIVRHPIYAVVLVLYFGTALAFPTWWNGVAFALVVAAHVLKTRLEDDFLAENLAPDYESYRQRVPYRLIPGVW